jgi:predicted DNA-binding transcriptional regulator YafY
MFSQDEIEAIGLGLQYVNHRGDMTLINAARQAYAKIKTALPTTSQSILEFPAICAGPLLTSFPENAVSLSFLRTAIAQRIKLHIIYNNTKGGTSDFIVWPFALLFLNDSRVLLAKDELSGGCRTLRTDKILRAESLNNPYPEWRINLVREYCDYMVLHGFNIE